MSPTRCIAAPLLLLWLGLSLAGAGTPQRQAQRQALRSPCTELVREVAGLGPPQRKAQQTCLTQHPGVQNLLEKLWKTEIAEADAAAVEPCVVTARGSAREKKLDPLKGCGVTCALNLLQEGGFDEELIIMRRCIAREAGQLNQDGIFNQSGLQHQLLAQVVGQQIENNTKLAVESCPPVVNFDVALYFRCVRSYCIKGEPPVDSSANSLLPTDVLRTGPVATYRSAASDGSADPPVELATV